jgi:hypothetical protein
VAWINASQIVDSICNNEIMTCVSPLSKQPQRLNLLKFECGTRSLHVGHERHTRRHLAATQIRKTETLWYTSPFAP